MLFKECSGMYRINEQNFLLWKVTSKSLTIHCVWWLQTANGDVISKRSEQRFAAPGEPECCVCGRFGAYICDEVWAWICSSFRFLQCFLLFVRPYPKNNYSPFDTWDTEVQHFYQFLMMLTLIVGIWWLLYRQKMTCAVWSANKKSYNFELCNVPRLAWDLQTQDIIPIFISLCC